MVKNPLVNAGAMGSIPGPRRIPHALEQLGPSATITEAPMPLPMVCDRSSHRDERPTRGS